MNSLAKLTRLQHNALGMILQHYGKDEVFSHNDVAEKAATLSQLCKKGLLNKSTLRYRGSNEQLYTLNREKALEVYKNGN